MGTGDPLVSHSVSVAGTTWLITSLIKTLRESEREFCPPSGSTQSYSKQPQAQNKAKALISLMQCWLATPRLYRNSQTLQLCSDATFCTVNGEFYMTNKNLRNFRHVAGPQVYKEEQKNSLLWCLCLFHFNNIINVVKISKKCFF